MWAPVLKIIDLGVVLILKCPKSDVKLHCYWTVVWLSWKSSHFRHQSSVVRIQYISCIEKLKKNRKRGREWANYWSRKGGLEPQECQLKRKCNYRWNKPNCPIGNLCFGESIRLWNAIGLPNWAPNESPVWPVGLSIFLKIFLFSIFVIFNTLL